MQLTTAVTGEDTTIIRDTPTSTTGKKKDVATPEQVAADTTLNQTSTVQKTYVIDYTSMYKDAIMETETGGLTYRYTFGIEKISAVLSPVDTSAGSIVQNGTVKLYYHRDRLGNTDYLTDNVQGKVVSYVDYDAWGNPLKKAVLKMGLREVDLVKDYTGHTYDPVLGKYYAKARLYDAESRRFMAADPVKGFTQSSMTLNPYLYVLNNPVTFVDPTGRFLKGTVLTVGAEGKDVSSLVGALKSAGIYIDEYASSYSYSEIVQYAVKEYIDRGESVVAGCNKILENRAAAGEYQLDAMIWSSLGLKINKTLEEEFWSGTKGNKVLSVTIKGNDVTISYNPKFYVQEKIGNQIYKDWRGDFEVSITKTASDKMFEDYMESAIKGFKMWGNYGKVDIQGVMANFIVNVTPTRVDKLSDANVRITAKSYEGSMVPTAVFWSTKKEPLVLLSDEYQYEGYDAFQQASAHEFGHVLGMFDLYGYGEHTKPFTIIGESAFPTASLDRGDDENIMRTHYTVDPQFESINYEMMLYAWQANQLQVYTNSIFGQTSQAFFH